MHTRYFLLPFSFLSGLFLMGALHAATLEDTVREAIKTNPDVLIIRSQRDSVEQEMEQARAGFFPQADITLGSGWETSDNPTTRSIGSGSRNFNRTEAEILIRQLLYDGQGTESEFARQKARVNSRANATFSTAEEIALRTVEVYIDVVREKMLVQLAMANLGNHQETYNRIHKRGERGIGRKADTQQAMGRLALAKTNLMAEQNNLDDATAAFIGVVGYAPDDLAAAISRDYLLSATFDETQIAALENHPRLKAAESDITAAQQQHTAAESFFYPRVHLEISGSHNDNLDGIPGRNKDAQIMVRGRYNFTGGKDTARRQETVFQLDEAREIRDRTRRQIIESIQRSWNAYETSHKQLEFFKIHLDSSKKALLAYRKQFNIGQRTLLDLLDQENEVFQASINHINGLNDAIFSTYRVLAGTGKLLWALEVPLPDEATTLK